VGAERGSVRLRVSAQIYNEEADLERLARALESIASTSARAGTF
jgi:selenocysteine lyase/cysteine desulfurase